MRRLFNIWIILLLLTVFDFFYFNAYAVNSSVVINEIAWMGTADSSYHEWIELKNLSDQEIDMSDWTLEALDGSPSMILSAPISPGGFYLLERSSDNTLPGESASQIYTGALSNAGEQLVLKDSQGNIVDRLDSDSEWPAGNNSSKQTMSRTASGVWKNSQEAGGTPGRENDFADEGSEESAKEEEINNSQDQEEDASNEGNFSDSEAPQSPKPQIKNIYINEIYPRPGDGESEWAELINMNHSTVDLDGCFLREGSGSRTNLSGSLSPGKFQLIDKPKGNLNNGGDQVELVCGEHILDRLLYGLWGSKDNPPAPAEGQSLARVLDGANTYSNKEDFAVTDLPTPGKANVIENSLEPDPDMAGYDFSDRIIVSEILPNPSGLDKEGEYIEFLNLDTRPVNLLGWRISDASGREYIFNSKSPVLDVGSKDRLVLWREESHLSLNNGGDTISLFAPEAENPQLVIKYGPAKEGESFNCPGTLISECYWTGRPSPEQKNSAPIETNKAPIADFDIPSSWPAGKPFLFNALESVDPEGDELDFNWDFGDGFGNNLPLAEHTYFSTGVYEVALSASDGTGSSSLKKAINITGSVPETAAAMEISGENQDTLMITEILPDPILDERSNEFIEIYNYGKQSVSLGSWSLDDIIDGGSKEFIFEKDRTIEPLSYIAVYSAESRLALNNDLDEANLLDAGGKVISAVGYIDPKAGLSYNLGENNKWFWSKEPSPGRKNIIKISSAIDAEEQYRTASVLEKDTEKCVEIALDELSGFKSGDCVTVKGTVIVRPGVLGSQFFYINDYGYGLQVYSYKKDFPNLKRGQAVRVSGVLSEIDGQKRLKISSKDDISALEFNELKEPEECSCGDIGEENIGALVSLRGEVIERKGSSIYLDDGESEARIYIKRSTGITAGDYAERDVIEAIGIISSMNSEKVLWPRSPQDIQKLSTGDSEDSVGMVLGEVMEGDEWVLESENKQTVFYKYLLVVSLAVCLFLGILIIKEKIEK